MSFRDRFSYNPGCAINKCTTHTHTHCTMGTKRLLRPAGQPNAKRGPVIAIRPLPVGSWVIYLLNTLLICWFSFLCLFNCCVLKSGSFYLFFFLSLFQLGLCGLWIFERFRNGRWRMLLNARTICRLPKTTLTRGIRLTDRKGSLFPIHAIVWPFDYNIF